MPYLYGQREVYLEGENKTNFFPTTLPTGQIQNFKALRAEHKSKGKLFEDPAFIPGPKILGALKALAGKNVKVVWKRPREVNPESVFSSFDHTSDSGARVYRADIDQGSLGDCYYIASVAVLLGSKKLTDFVIPPDNTEDESAGIYHFRFWIQGVYYDIVVDDRIPYGVDEDGTYVLLFAKNKGGNDIWPMLVEKAYAKMKGSYGAIGSGGQIAEALQDMSGGIAHKTTLTAKTGEIEWDDLFAKTQYGVLTGFGTGENELKGLVHHHAYSLVDKQMVKDNKGNEYKLLRLRNPWGGIKEWTGAWSDKSTLWNTIPAAEKERLHKDFDDGEFWMSFGDATKGDSFGSVSFCHWRYDLDKVPDPTRHHWQWEDVHGAWSGEGTWDVQNSAGLAKKPQYLITVKHDETSKDRPNGILIISLICKGYLNKNWTKPADLGFKVYKVKDADLIKHKPPFGPGAFDNKDKLVKLDYIKELKRLDHEHTAQGCVSAGSYLIVPYTTKGVAHNFMLRIGSAHNFTVFPDPPTPGEKQNLKYYEE